MKEHIINVLSKYGACTPKQVAFLVSRDYDEQYKPASISGILRTMVASGDVGRSNCGIGATHYWIRKY